MAAPKWGNWFIVDSSGEDEGVIPARYLPAGWLQYRWTLDAEFDIPGSWGFSGGSMRLDWEIGLGSSFASNDRVTFICATLFGMYTYYAGTIVMTGQDTYETLGKSGGYYVDDGSSGGMGLPYIRGELYSPLYRVALPAGSVVDVQHFSPQVELMGGYVLWMRTAPGAGGKRKMLIDPVTNDQYLPRIENRMLVCRTDAYDGSVGRRSGLLVSYAGGEATATAGSAVIGWQECTADSVLTCPVATTGVAYVFLVPNSAGGIDLVTDVGPRASAAWCVGRVTNGVYASCDGVLVADGADDYAIARREDGSIVLRYDSGSLRDLSKVSRDRGVTWA